ncbi:helix-turn-helix domain-containing protein [Teichococcus aestuarii]|uniref:helix-turn-helix domain-containing protein n=1 Tax=Teichococcus aestuarii TaxID=568898 RepID=UPI00360ACAE3
MPYDLKRSNRSNENPAEALRVGEELREARLSLGISLEEMAERLRINRRYIAALEDGRVADLPGAAYGIGFVRSYAQAMGLDAPDWCAASARGRGRGRAARISSSPSRCRSAACRPAPSSWWGPCWPSAPMPAGTAGAARASARWMRCRPCRHGWSRRRARPARRRCPA